MRSVQSEEAKHDLEGLIEQVIADAEPAIVTTEAGKQVVILPLDEYNAWQESRYLLASPANAEHLHRSIAQARVGDIEERELLEP
jgi:antitoxin YefM